MEQRTILILRGLQGSGKTTFARQWVAENQTQRVRFNRDDVRNMLGPYWVPKREHLITDLYWEFLNNATANGYDIVIDNMNLNENCIEELIEFVEDTNDFLRLTYLDIQYKIEIKDFFNVPLEECISRDSKRENPIGEKVIRQTYNKYKDKIAPWKYLN